MNFLSEKGTLRSGGGDERSLCSIIAATKRYYCTSIWLLHSNLKEAINRWFSFVEKPPVSRRWWKHTCRLLQVTTKEQTMFCEMFALYLLWALFNYGCYMLRLCVIQHFSRIPKSFSESFVCSIHVKIMDIKLNRTAKRAKTSKCNNVVVGMVK